MSNSKQFDLPGGGIAYGTVPIDPLTGLSSVESTRAFKFAAGSTQVSLVTAVAAAITGLDANAEALHLLAVGTQVVQIRIDAAASATLTADFPLMPGVPAVVTKPVGATRISFIASGVGSSIFVTPGYGKL